MSRIRANTITNQNANGAPNFPDGITVTGVVTATTTSQNITGDLTVSGNVGVGGTITYEDVTNVDSIGIITARTGVIVGSGVTLNATGVIATGVITATSFSGSGANLTNLPPSAPVGGASTNQVFFENDNSVDVNYSVTSGKNAMSAGPIAIKSGITVTVPSGSFWTIV